MNASRIPLRGIAGQKRYYLIEVSPDSEADRLINGYLSNPSHKDGVRRWKDCVAHFPYEALGILAGLLNCFDYLRTWMYLQSQFPRPKQEGDRNSGDRPQA